MAEPDKKETAYLKTVQSCIDSEQETLNDLSEELEDKIMAEGQKFSLDNPYASVYGGSSVAEHQYSLERKIQRSETAKYEAYFLKKLRSSPYFARVDFKETGFDEEQFYIGIKSLFDEKELAPYVYDWRAPVASLFYEDFDGEEAYFEAPSGKITGEVLRKRQYKFKNGKIIDCFESKLKIDDAILQEALSESSTNKLKIIVSSIQKEQNKAIRFSGEQNLVVSGPAGSGKTSVGFHRLAYLLYKNRDKLSSSEIITFTSSDIFSSYVADIIPELGEAPIRDFSFYKLFNRYLGTLRATDYYELAEELINKNSAREAEVNVKFSKSFIALLEKSVKAFVPSFSDFKLYDETVFTGKDALHYLNRRKKSRNFYEQSDVLAEFCAAKTEDFFIKNYKKIYEDLNKKSSVLDDTAKLVAAFKKESADRAKKQLLKELNGNDAFLLYKAYKKYEAITGEGSVISDAYKKSLARNAVKFEDALLLIYIKSLFGKINVNTGVRHVLIDEAQDFLPLQHKIIRSLYPKAKFTVLTDSAQAILPPINSTDVSEIAEIYSAQILTLNKSYRSTKEISEFSKALLGNADYETFERSGAVPETVEIKKGGEYEFIKSCLKETDGTACIITKTTAYAREVYNELVKDLKLKLYDDKRKTFSEKIAVLPLCYSKGLEFDNVVILSSEDNDFFGEENKRYLYMASTRALHSLRIIKIID
ncbi:MAG: UvrD-helicase domain-containing protein [Clostridia bacterium]|nr:UvrD-helicase domain-containing protein [Clostridia bacterium]